MGFFSKKTFTCERCGNQFEARLASTICSDCLNKEYEQRDRIKGYIEYRKACKLSEIPYEEMPNVEAHRQALGDKFYNDQGITLDEVYDAGKHYRSLTPDQARDILRRTMQSTVAVSTGASNGEEFYVLSEYESVIVDMEDVFAAGFTHVKGYDNDQVEVILLVLFTNDPYVPVIPQIYLGKIGFWGYRTSKKGRDQIADEIEASCPNLQYPVTDLKLLRKAIKNSGNIDARIDQQTVLRLIDDAIGQRNLFKVEKLAKKQIPDGTRIMLEGMGYILDIEADQALQMDKMLARHYWEKVAKEL